MQILFDIIPIIVFFLFYKIAGIYVATAAAIIVSCIQVLYFRYRHKHFEKMQVITFFMILILGSATIILHNPLFIKWKPSVIYWVFSLAFLISGVWRKKPLIQNVLEKKIQLPSKVWRQLNWAWCFYFLFLGFANIYVVYHYSTNTWVNFKLFGTLIITFMFVIAQGLYLSKYMPKDEPKK